jgi:hypothetical protein
MFGPLRGRPASDRGAAVLAFHFTFDGSVPGIAIRRRLRRRLIFAVFRDASS